MRPHRTASGEAGILLRRFVVLQAAMVIGAAGCLLVGTALRGSPAYAAVYHPGTVLYFVGDLFFLTFPVVAWLILRGRGWRHALGMGLAMVAPVAAIVLVGETMRSAYLLWLVTAMYPAMSVGMLAHLFLAGRGPGSRRLDGCRRAAWDP